MSSTTSSPLRPLVSPLSVPQRARPVPFSLALPLSLPLPPSPPPLRPNLPGPRTCFSLPGEPSVVMSSTTSSPLRSLVSPLSVPRRALPFSLSLPLSPSLSTSTLPEPPAASCAFSLELGGEPSVVMNSTTSSPLRLQARLVSHPSPSLGPLSLPQPPPSPPPFAHPSFAPPSFFHTHTHTHTHSISVSLTMKFAMIAFATSAATVGAVQYTNDAGEAMVCPKDGYDGRDWVSGGSLRALTHTDAQSIEVLASLTRSPSPLSPPRTWTH